jgi:hypothetical protein
MRLPVGRPRHSIPWEWSQMDQEDRRPTAGYLWDVVAMPHATQARAYIEYKNELDDLMPSSISTYYSFCHTPFRERGNEASIRVPRMFKSHI